MISERYKRGFVPKTDEEHMHSRMVRMFDFMRDLDNPPALVATPYSVMARQGYGAEEEESYYTWESSDETFNLGAPDGRKAWAEGGPAYGPGRRVTIETPELWCDYFYVSHLKPKLLGWIDLYSDRNGIHNIHDAERVEAPKRRD